MVRETLGAGAMGVVYRAHDDAIGRDVVVKRIDLQRKTQKAMNLFYREANAVAGLSHRNIVALHDFGEEDDGPYLVMELLDGQDLATMLRKSQPMPLAWSLEVVAQVCDGLDHAHERGVIHQGIRPGNLRILPSGQVKILDFGVARIVSAASSVPGGVVGTPAFIAPEQLLGNPLDGRADLFSVGVILYLLLTGRRPFPGRKPMEVVQRVVVAPPEPFSADELAPWPPRLVKTILQALEKEPSRRHPSAAELASELRDVLSALPRAEDARSHRAGTRSLVEAEAPASSVNGPANDNATSGDGESGGPDPPFVEPAPTTPAPPRAGAHPAGQVAASQSGPVVAPSSPRRYLPAVAIASVVAAIGLGAVVVRLVPRENGSAAGQQAVPEPTPSSVASPAPFSVGTGAPPSEATEVAAPPTAPAPVFVDIATPPVPGTAPSTTEATVEGTSSLTATPEQPTGTEEAPVTPAAGLDPRLLERARALLARGDLKRAMDAARASRRDDKWHPEVDDLEIAILAAARERLSQSRALAESVTAGRGLVPRFHETRAREQGAEAEAAQGRSAGALATMLTCHAEYLSLAKLVAPASDWGYTSPASTFPRFHGLGPLEATLQPLVIAYRDAWQSRSVEALAALWPMSIVERSGAQRLIEQSRSLELDIESCDYKLQGREIKGACTAVQRTVTRDGREIAQAQEIHFTFQLEGERWRIWGVHVVERALEAPAANGPTFDRDAGWERRVAPARAEWGEHGGGVARPRGDRDRAGARGHEGRGTRGERPCHEAEATDDKLPVASSGSLAARLPRLPGWCEARERPWPVREHPCVIATCIRSVPPVVG